MAFDWSQTESYRAVRFGKQTTITDIDLIHGGVELLRSLMDAKGEAAAGTTDLVYGVRAGRSASPLIWLIGCPVLPVLLAPTIKKFSRLSM